VSSRRLPVRAPLALILALLAAHLATALWFVLDRSPGSAAAWVGLPLDDAWIHLVYSRSIAALQGFAYNPGQLETGSTSPLWAIVLVPASWLARLCHASVVLPSKVTTLAAGVGASLAAARLARGLGFGVGVGAVAGLVIAVDPALAFAQVSGMEVMLASALALWAVGELAHARYHVAGIAAGLAPLARPEMALLSLPVLALAEWRLHAEGASAKRRVQALLPGLLAVGGWASYCGLVTGYLLPSTFYVKAAMGTDQLARNLVLIFTEILPASPWFRGGAGVVLLAIGTVMAWRRGAVGQLTVAFPWVYFLGVAASRELADGQSFYFLRYLLPAEPFLLATMAMGGVGVVAWAWRHRRAAWAPGYALAVAALLMVTLARLPSSLAAEAHLFAWNCQNIEELNVAMAVWLKDHVPASDTILVGDAGAARYFAQHRIIDAVGLNDHAWLHREPRAVSELGHARYAAFFPALIPELSQSPSWRPIHRTHTEHLTICTHCRQSEIVAYQRIQQPDR